MQYFTDRTTRMRMALKLLESAYYAGYRAKSYEDSTAKLFGTFLKGFSALFLQPSKPKLKPTPETMVGQPPELQEVDTSDEMEGTYYSFQLREASRGNNFTTTIFLDLVANKTIKFPVPDTGYMLGFGKQTSLICNEAKPGTDDHNVVKKEWVYPFNEQTECHADNDVYLENLNYINLFKSSLDNSGLVVINYLTTYLRFRYYNCEMLIEVAGCVMRTVRFARWAYFDFNNDTHAYPIAHIMINRHVDNTGCMIALCAIINDAEETITRSKFKGVLIHVQPERKQLRHLLSVEPSHDNGAVKQKYRNKCNTKNQLLPYMRSIIHTLKNPLPGQKVAFCNGTKHTSLPLGSLHQCYSVANVQTHHQCPGLSHNVKAVYDEENVSCTVDYHTIECDQGYYCFHLKMNGSGPYTVRGDGYSHVDTCDGSCTVKVPLTESSFVITCPDGEGHLLRYNLFNHSCPLIKYLGNSAFFICRATKRPGVFYAAFFWLFGGCPFTYLVFTLLKYGTLFLTKIIIKLKLLADRSKGICQQCGDFVRSRPEWQRHEDCKFGNCPYCRSRLSLSSLKKHICQCLEREAVLDRDSTTVERRLVPSMLRLLGTVICWLQRAAVKSTWLLVSFVLVIVLISPVQSLHNVNLKPGLWEKEVVEVELCDDKCYVSNDRCYCKPNTEDTSRLEAGNRKLLEVDFPFKLGYYGSKAVQIWNNTVSASVVLDVKTPWGTVNVGKTHSPSYSTSSIRMTWSSVIKDDHGHIILSGKSTSLMPVGKDTGLSWELTTEKSSEKRILTVSVLDSTQIYNARFNYLTGDRKIGSWMHGTCSGNCPDKCGCDRTSCISQTWMKSRNWHCNPTWCWRVDEGCTCCAADVETLYNDWIVTKWSLEYVSTEALICVDYDHDTRSCDILNGELTFHAGPYKVQISEVMSEKFKLPDEISIFHKVPGDDTRIDLMKVHHVTSARNMCKLQSCTHGSAGDSQVYNLNHFISNDIRSEYFFLQKDKKKVEREHWMSWEGVDLDYHCDSGHWPKCYANGAVTHNKEAFENLLKVEQDYLQSFFFHVLACRLNGSIPALELQARPKRQAGNINVYVEVNKLRLNPIDAEITELKMSIYECKGCYGCLEGGECTIGFLIKGVEKIGLHVISRTDHVTVSESTIIVSALERAKTTIKFFSAVKVKELCFTVEELDICKSCDPDYKVCKTTELKEPEGILIEHRGSLITTQKDNCTGKIVCWSGSFLSLFSGLGKFLSFLGGGLLKGVLYILLPGLVIFAFIVWGPQLLSLMRAKGLIRRGLKGRLPLKMDEGILSLEKMFTKDKLQQDDLLNLIVKNK